MHTAHPGPDVPRRAVRAAGDVVRSLLRGEPFDAAGAARVDPAAFELVVHHHRVGPSLDHLLAALPAPQVAHLRPVTRRSAVVQAARALTVQLDLRTVADALRDLPWSVLKGPAVAATAHGGAPREYHDLDVLVPPTAFGAALRELEARGARAMDPDWAGIRAAGAGEIAVALPHGTFLDLHWHLVNRPSRRERFRVDVDAMLERRRPTTLLGTPAAVLDPVDQLHHLALHACLSGAWRLLWLHDLRAASAAADWDELVRRTREAGTGLATAMALDRARRVLDAPVPPQALRALAGGSTWTALGALTTALRPPHLLTGTGRNGAVLYSTTAGGLTGSAVCLLAELHHRAGTGTRAEEVDDAPGVGRREPGASSEREGYLADVATSGTR